MSLYEAMLLALWENLSNNPPMASCFQCSSGAGAPVAAPSTPTNPAQYRDTVSGFNYRWDVQSASWQAIPKVYRASLTQSGANPPVATVLENTIGPIVWSRSTDGIYFATLAGAFPSGKTLVFGSVQGNDVAFWGSIFTDSTATCANWVSANVVQVLSGHIAVENLDGFLSNFPIEILVYP